MKCWLWPVYYAYKGIQANSNRHDAILRNLPYLGLAGVGILSALFHATCKDWTQWGKFRLFQEIHSSMLLLNLLCGL